MTLKSCLKFIMLSFPLKNMGHFPNTLGKSKTFFFLDSRVVQKYNFFWELPGMSSPAFLLVKYSSLKNFSFFSKTFRSPPKLPIFPIDII